MLKQDDVKKYSDHVESLFKLIGQQLKSCSDPYKSFLKSLIKSMVVVDGLVDCFSSLLVKVCIENSFIDLMCEVIEARAELGLSDFRSSMGGLHISDFVDNDFCRLVFDYIPYPDGKSTYESESDIFKDFVLKMKERNHYVNLETDNYRMEIY